MKKGLFWIWLMVLIGAIAYTAVIMDQNTPVPLPTATPKTVKATATPRPTVKSVSTSVDPYEGMHCIKWEF